MKILIVGPIRSPIIQRLKYFLFNQGVIVKVASFNADGFDDVYNLGELNGFFAYLNIFKLRKIVKEFEPDVVHAHIINHYGLMSLFCPRPVLLAAWGSDALLSTKTSNKLKNLIFYFLNTIAVKNADHLHTSSSNVANILLSDFGGKESKLSTFYWGLPLVANETEELVSTRLYKEFGLDLKKNIVVFNRGVSDIYNPRKVIEIIDGLYESDYMGQIVVLKGFASNAEYIDFKKRLHPKVILIDRLLNDSELYFIYNNSMAHFSIPRSDALGGGVIEPALLGSHPILSDLPQYIEYKSQNPASILKEETTKSIIKSIVSGELSNSPSNIPSSDHEGDSIIKKFISIYQKLLEG